MEREASLEQWQKQAAKGMITSRNPQVAFDVLARTATTATTDIVMEPMREGEDTEKLRAAIRAMLVAKGASEETLQGLQAAKTLGPAITVENPDGSENPRFVVEMPPQGAYMLDALQLAMGIDKKMLFGEGPKAKFIIEDYAEMYNNPNSMQVLATLLYQHFGDEVIDLCIALILYGAKEEHRADKIQLDLTTFDFPEEAKKSILQKTCGQITFLEEESYLPILKWALGEKFLQRFREEYAELEKTPVQFAKKVLERLKELIETKQSIRRKFERALRRLPQTADKGIASTFIRQGWRTLVGIDEVTDYEWWTYVRQQQEEIEKSPELMKRIADDQKKMEANERRKKDIEEFFKKNEPPKKLKTLAEKIGCEKMREELEKLRDEWNPVAYACKQKEIALRIFAEVTRYTGGRTDPEHKFKSYKLGFPATVVKEKQTTCFSGPWLIAMMLYMAGINADSVFYCHVNESCNGLLGGHGALLLKTAMQEVIVLDHGLNSPDTQFPIHFCGSKKIAQNVSSLINGKTNSPVHVKFHKDITIVSGMHPDIIVMRMHDGFASGHLLHIGISFIHENKLDEAEYALEMALTYHHGDPDILYYLGMINFKKEKLEEAKAYFEEAIEAFDGHLQSHFALGEIAMRENNQDEARKRFELVAKDERTIWGDDTFKKRAIELTKQAQL